MEASEFAAQLTIERAKIPKLEIVFGQWWKHYTPPFELACLLYCERDNCPYCGAALGPFYQAQKVGVPSFRVSAHLEHMDPLLRGGEDSIRNAVYVCAACNLRKRSRRFIDWLTMIDPAYQVVARSIYIEKHGHSPEEFVPAGRNPRTATWLRSLAFDETVLRRLFPKPVVSGPPACRSRIE